MRGMDLRHGKGSPNGAMVRTPKASLASSLVMRRIVPTRSMLPLQRCSSVCNRKAKVSV